VDHWISFAASLEPANAAKMDQLEKSLAMASYLVGQSLTAADLAVWGSLFGKHFRSNCFQLEY